MKKYLLTSALVIFVVLQGFAQRFDYEKTSKIFFGLNIGSVWHTSDVENAKERFPLGAGFVFGGSINQNYGNAVSFDLRFRYLGGTWYGKDSDTTSAILNNYAVNPIYDTLGYTVQNFRAAQHRFALELSMHANRFKERTGIDPYIFGGIGITASNINGDLLKNTNEGNIASAYPYNETPNGSIIEEKYETPLDMNAEGASYTPNDFDFKVLPSLGVGIGYYFNNRFSMGVEHKTTFFRNDYFDGTSLNQEGQASDLIKNDLYHYTSIYFKWYLRGSKRNTWEPPIDDKPVTENPVIRKDLPFVDFTNPSNSPHRTNSPNIKLRAKVQNVAHANKIAFTHNQRKSNNFSFNSSAQEFRAQVQLNPGLNVFFLEGENQFGKDSDVMEIYYEELDKGNPPVVKITNPSRVPHYINRLNFTVTANIQNVTARNLVKVYFNDQVVNNFNFTQNGNNNFSIPLNLKAGNNTLRIEGRNEYGQDFDEAIIIYRRDNNENKKYPPKVNITTPISSPFTTDQAYENVLAQITNVDNKQLVEVRVNGNVQSNFNFNKLNNNTYKVILNVALNPGVNTIKISATNNYGNDFDETQIIYRRGGTDVGNPPIVNILTPSVSPYTTNQASENIIAKVDNVNTKQQVKVRINGVQTNNFSFNSATGRVEFTASLNSGTNTIRVSAINSKGNDFDETVIVYRSGNTGSNLPPKVDILNPSNNPFSTDQSSENVVAKVENVNNKSQIEVRINGVQTNNFVFNSATNRVQFSASLNEGTNTVKVSASNAFGNDFDDVNIVFRPKVVKNPPVVNILSPNVNPFTTDQMSQNVIAKVENVDTKNQIEVRINGTQTNNFVFNSATDRVQFTAPLNSGINTVKVSAATSHGNDFDETKIIYRRGTNSDLPPVVNILTPNSNPKNTFLFNEKVIAKVENVNSKSQIEVQINGVKTNNFTFTSATSRVEFNTALKVGSNNIKVSAQNPYGNDFDESTIILNKKVIVKPPFVSFIAPKTGQQPVTETNFTMIAKVERVSRKADIKVYLNGNIISANKYTFNSFTQIVNYPSQLELGENTFIVRGENESGNHQASIKITRKKKGLSEAEDNKGIVVNPCDLPTIKMISPKISETSVGIDNNVFQVTATINHINSVNQILVYKNGNLMDGYNYTVATKIFTHLLKIDEGRNTYKIKVTNSCGTVEKDLVFIREVEPSCGVKFELINSNSEFCLTTGSGTITGSDLISNPNYSYNGTASSIYFKATENGKASVNGADYNVVKGNYYHFVGIITVDIAKNKPGMNNQWSVCVQSVRPPLFGKGSSKPSNPCTMNKNSKPEVKPKPKVRNKPNTQDKPDVRKKTSNTKEGTRVAPKKESEPKTGSEIKVTPRNVRNPG